MKNSNKVTATAMSAAGILMALSGQAAAAQAEAVQCAANFSDYKVEVFSAAAPTAAAADSDITFYPNIASGYKILGGGAVIDTLSGDAFITASYPDVDPGMTVPVGWTVASKHIGTGTSSRITGFAIAVFDPNDCWDVQVFSNATTTPAAHPTTSVTVGQGYVLAGGGALVTQNPGGNGNFLFKSIPNTAGNGWVVQSKDHQVSDHANITAYAIGIKAKGAGVVTPTSYSLAGRVSAANVDPMAYANGANGILPGRNCVLTGGGANDAWTSYGNMLTANYPAGTNTWIAFGRSFGVDDASVMTAYTVCLQ